MGGLFCFRVLLARASFTVMSECYRFGHGGFAACTVAYYGCNGEGTSRATLPSIYSSGASGLEASGGLTCHLERIPGKHPRLSWS